MSRLIICADPGASASITAALDDGGPRVQVVWQASIWGSSRRSWMGRAISALGELEHVTGDYPADGPQRLHIEVPASNSKSRRGKLGPATFTGLGRMIGRLEALAFSAGYEVLLVDSGAWPKVLGLPTGKRGDGAHRLGEAAMHCIWSGAPRPARGESNAETERAICLAESALMCAAVARGVEVR